MLNRVNLSLKRLTPPVNELAKIVSKYVLALQVAWVSKSTSQPENKHAVLKVGLNKTKTAAMLIFQFGKN